MSATREIATQPTRPFWHWNGPSVEELIRQLNAGPVERVEVHIDDAQRATFVVVPRAVPNAAPSPYAPINESFVCPPRCP